MMNSTANRTGEGGGIVQLFHKLTARVRYR